MCEFIEVIMYLFTYYSFIHSSVRSLTHPLTLSLICSATHSIIQAFVHLFNHSVPSFIMRHPHRPPILHTFCSGYVSGSQPPTSSSRSAFTSTDCLLPGEDTSRPHATTEAPGAPQGRYSSTGVRVRQQQQQYRSGGTAAAAAVHQHGTQHLAASCSLLCLEELRCSKLMSSVTPR